MLLLDARMYAVVILPAGTRKASGVGVYISGLAGNYAIYKLALLLRLLTKQKKLLN